MLTPFAAPAVNIGNAAYTVLHTLTLSGSSTITFELDSLATSTHALASFVIERRVHEDADWQTWLEDADFSSDEVPDMMFCQTSPMTLAAGANSQCTVKSGVAESLRFKAKSAGTSNVILRGVVET